MRRNYIHGRSFNGVYYNWDPWRGKGPVRCRALKRSMERYYILEMPERETDRGAAEGGKVA